MHNRQTKIPRQWRHYSKFEWVTAQTKIQNNAGPVNIYKQRPNPSKPVETIPSQTKTCKNEQCCPENCVIQKHDRWAQ
jgi:hypothetical protein